MYFHICFPTQITHLSLSIMSPLSPLTSSHVIHSFIVRSPVLWPASTLKNLFKTPRPSTLKMSDAATPEGTTSPEGNGTSPDENRQNLEPVVEVVQVSPHRRRKGELVKKKSPTTISATIKKSKLSSTLRLTHSCTTRGIVTSATIDWSAKCKE